MLHFQDVQNVYIDKYPPSILFSMLSTKNALNKFLIEEMHMVAPERIIISTNLEWKKKKSTAQVELCEVYHDAYIIPFIANLKTLLMNEDIRSNVDNPLEHENGVYRTVLDGSYYQENTFFREHKNSLAIILYYDDLGIANPLGTSSKIHKLSMFYWVLANIKPELRSSKNAIQLLAIVKTNYAKEPKALEKILQPFIDDIIKLQTEGVDIYINGSKKNYKESLLFFAGDIPASALIGDFKESVFANHPCRSCMITKNDIKNYFKESNLILRNKIEDHLNAINEPSITKRAKEFWQKTYGVNNKSPLMEIPYFDITTCLPQDCMHILIEGVTEITCRLFLCYCIIEKHFFSIEDFNEKLASFNFGHFNKDKPAAIQRNDLTVDKPLRQSAAQMFVLAHTLPFLIAEWILNNESADLNNQVDCFILMLQIMNLCLAYEITTESIDLLSRIIETFLSRFVLLYPDNIVPKHHFLIHVPRYIRLFGPGRQQWCFRFESAHAYFKSLVPIVRNFKNMPYTMSYRHQARLCSEFISYPGQLSKRFLYEGDKITAGSTILLRNLPYAKLFDSYVEEFEKNSYQIMQSPRIIIHGTTYQNQSILLLECEENSMPVFGELNDICVLGNNTLFVITSFETICYESKLNAYQIVKPSNNRQSIVNINNLIFPHPLSDFKIRNTRFIPLINHERCEFLG